MFTLSQVIMAAGLAAFAAAWLFTIHVQTILLITSGALLLIGGLLRLSTQAPSQAKCPECRETIQPDARRCKHCHATLQA